MRVSLVDATDVHFLNEHAWYVNHTGYVVATSYKNGVQSTVSLARLVMDALPNEYIDHINGIKTDNRKSNLRRTNQKVNRLNTTKTNGVRKTTSGKFQARVQNKNYGSFDTYEEAKRVRDEVTKTTIINEQNKFTNFRNSDS